jgi:type I restriction enzyme S subunit
MGRETPVIGLSRLKPYSTYKDSGVEWLGDIPAHWETAPVRFLSRRGHKTFTDGDWIESPFIRNEGIRLIQTGNIGIGAFKEQGFRYIDEETFRAFGCTEIMPGDVLICRLADPVGRACLAPDLGVRMITSVDVCILKPDNNVDAAFLVYALSGEEYLSWMASICRGGTRDRVSRSMLGSNLIQKPPYEEQRAISAFLDRETAKIDALIEKNERLIELLQEKRMALITHAVTKGLDPSVPMKDSGVEWLGKIPAHWGFKRLKRIVEFRGGGTPSKDNLDYWHGDILWVSPKDMKVSVVMDTEDKITPQAVRESATKLVPAGAVLLVVRSGILMHSIPVALSGRKLTLNQDLKALIPRSDLLPEYLFYLISGMQRKLLAEWKKEGATVESLEIDLVAQTQTPLPDEGEQHGIAVFLDRQTAKIDVLMSKIREAIDCLKEYRTALISAAVTGKIDVREV